MGLNAPYVNQNYTVMLKSILKAFTGTQISDVVTVKDLAIAQQVVNRAYDRGLIGRRALMASVLDTQHRTAILLQTVKTGSYIKTK